MIDFSEIGIDFLMPRYDGDFFWSHNRITHLDGRFVSLLNSSDRFIIDFTVDPIDQLQIEMAADLLSCHDLEHRAIFLISNNLSSDRVETVFFPFWLYNSSYWWSPNNTDFNLNRRYFISCLNRMPRPHRLYLFHQLYHRSYFSESLISCRGLRDPSTGEFISAGHEIYDTLPADTQEFFAKQDRSQEAIYGDSAADDHTQTNSNIMHPAYTDTLLNIVTETSYTDDSVFFSEKVCKPIASQQLFVIIGNIHSVRYLRSLGFDCFDRHLQHHSYDQIDSWIKRIDNAVSLLDQIYCHLPDIYHDNQKSIKHNQQWFLSQTFRNQLLSPLKNHDLI